MPENCKECVKEAVEKYIKENGIGGDIKSVELCAAIGYGARPVAQCLKSMGYKALTVREGDKTLRVYRKMTISVCKHSAL